MNNPPYRTQGMVDTKHLLDEIETLKKENEKLKQDKDLNAKNDAKIWLKTIQENGDLKKENEKLQEEVKKLKEESTKQVPLETYKEVKVISLKEDKLNPFFGNGFENPNAKPAENTTSHILSEHAKHGWEVKHVDLASERYLLEREVTTKKK